MEVNAKIDYNWQIAFIIPSKGQPRECYNEITPNDMQNDVRCALMGISLFFGVWVVILSCEQYLHLIFTEQILTVIRLFQNSALAHIRLLGYQVEGEI